MGKAYRMHTQNKMSNELCFIPIASEAGSMERNETMETGEDVVSSLLLRPGQKLFLCFLYSPRVKIYLYY